MAAATDKYITDLGIAVAATHVYKFRIVFDSDRKYLNFCWNQLIQQRQINDTIWISYFIYSWRCRSKHGINV